MIRHFLLSILLIAIGQISMTAQEISKVPLADPYILLAGNTYFAYGTHSADGIEVWSSQDLKYWEYRGLALDKANTTETQWFWAPEIYYKKSKYYMYYSANEHLYVATSRSPLGPFVQVGSYQMENLLGDEKCIDSSVFFDDDGTAWLFFVRFNDGNCIWMCQLADDYITPVEGTLRKCINVSQDWETDMGRVNEGPNIIKNGSRYYLTYSGNDYRSQEYAVGYATTRSLSNGSWTKYANNPIVYKVEDLVGTGHHTLFYDKDGLLRIVFHAHKSTTEVNPRYMYIGTMEFSGIALKMKDTPIIRPDLQSNAPSGINDLQTEDAIEDTRYNISGLRISATTKGVNLVKKGNGKFVKVLE